MKLFKLVNGLGAVILFSLLITQPAGLVSCKNNEKKSPDSTPPPAAQAQAMLPDEAFWTLRAGQDTVALWIAQNGANDRNSRLVFIYAWPSRTSSKFTLVTQMASKQDRKLFTNGHTLKFEAQHTPANIPADTVMFGSNQVSIRALKELWGFRNLATYPNEYYWIKFTPIFRADATCATCSKSLVYQIDLMPEYARLSTGDYDSGYTNPSPPKQPED
jgi:hypothetical protein